MVDYLADAAGGKGARWRRPGQHRVDGKGGPGSGGSSKGLALQGLKHIRVLLGGPENRAWKLGSQ